MTAPNRDTDDLTKTGLFDDDNLDQEDSSLAPRRRGMILLLPFLVFAALAGLFFFALEKGGDPSKLPSVLVGKPAPQFALPPVDGLVDARGPVPGFSRDDLTQGKVSVVNIWASWCVPCHQEHPLLSELKKAADIQLLGLNYKDAAISARRFIGRYGNPFDAIGADRQGRVAIDWGVYGVPETFVVDGRGKIVFKLVGPITKENLVEELLPAIDKARQTS